MTLLKKTLAVGTGSLMVVAGLGSTVLATTQAVADSAEGNSPQTQENTVSKETSIVKKEVVEGTFSFNQTTVSSLDSIRKNIGEASSYLCGTEGAQSEENTAAQDWSISFTGLVDNPQTIAVSDLVEKEDASPVIMGCSCTGNPSDGLATANALVNGVSTKTLLAAASPSEEANTVVFTSSDGYSVAVPLSYVKQHKGLLVFDVNGSPLADSVGGVNQLWLGSTPANYFVRNVTSISFENRIQAPPSPTSEEARAELGNLPNIGVIYGGDIQ